MAGGPAPQDSGGDKNTYYILWVMALIVAVGGGIWYFFSEQIKVFFIFLKVNEAKGLYYSIAWLSQFNIPFVNNHINNLGQILSIAQLQTPATLNLNVAGALSNAIGQYLRFPVAIIIIFIMFYTYKHHILMRCTQKHNMKSLMIQESEIWPQIEIVKNLNLVEQDLESGPWAMAMTPLQFAKKYKLMEVSYAEKIGSQFAKTQSPEFKLTLLRSRTERAFIAQLGRPWQRVEVLAPHRKAIFAVLAARVGRDSKASRQMVYQLASSAARGSPNYTGIDEMIKKHLNNSVVQKVIHAHAYEFTVFASMLLSAREDGVVASADFLWIKPIDRRLWYVLNNVGRQTPAVEVGGIFTHWYTELALKRPLSVPDVAGAVDALELALAGIIYVPDDKEREEINKREQERHPQVQTQSPSETQGMA